METTALIIMGLSPGELFPYQSCDPPDPALSNPGCRAEMVPKCMKSGSFRTNFVESDRRRRGGVKICYRPLNSLGIRSFQRAWCLPTASGLVIVTKIHFWLKISEMLGVKSPETNWTELNRAGPFWAPRGVPAVGRAGSVSAFWGVQWAQRSSSELIELITSRFSQLHTRRSASAKSSPWPEAKIFSN